MIKGCLSLISGLLTLVGLFLILKDCGFIKAPPSTVSSEQKQLEMQSDAIKAKSDSKRTMFTEITSITVRNRKIKVGDTSDYAFSILKLSDRIKGPDIERNDKLSIKPVVTQHYEVDGKVFDIMIVLLKQNEPYRVGKILLVNNEPVGQPYCPF